MPSRKLAQSPHSSQEIRRIHRRWEQFTEAEQAKLLATAQLTLSRKTRRSQVAPSIIVYLGPKRRKQKKRHAPVIAQVSGPFAYRDRNKILQDMGFDSYTTYLQSDLWKRIRKRVFKRSRTCYICRARATEPHHSSYHREALEGSDLSGIFPLCHTCHGRIEFQESTGEKLNPWQATKKMKTLRAEWQQPKSVQKPLVYIRLGAFRILV